MPNCSKCSSSAIGFTKETIKGGKRKVYYCLNCYGLHGKYGIKGTINKFNKISKTVREKKPTIKSLDAKALELWSLVVKKRANFICEYPFCSKNTYLNSHHIVSRVNRSTRYDLDNGICLCAGHHTLLKEAAHKDPFFKDKLIEYGIRLAELFTDLRRKANEICKNTVDDLQNIIQNLQSEEQKYH